MAVNDPLVPKARKPLSAEEAEWFASQIRPSWELMEPEARAADALLPEAAAVGAAASSKPSSAPDTVHDPTPRVSTAAPAAGARGGVLRPTPIKAGGGNRERGVVGWPLPPARGKPLLPAESAKAAGAPRPAPPVARARFGKTQVGIGSEEEEE